MSGKAKQIDFFDKIQLITEKFLTHRARIRRIKKEKRKAKNPVLDWIEAFIWAVCMVLLINQYLIQAYRIPSGSMIDTLNIGDHVFVNKIVYGPELLPGFFKLPSIFQPKRNDIIIFESPAYISRGTVFDITQRILYMLTLSLVDIDRDENGEPRVHFLIKRAVGQAGDRLNMENGRLKIRFAGENRWVDEMEYNEKRGWNHNIIRSINEDQYPAYIASVEAEAWNSRIISGPFESQTESIRFNGNIELTRAWYETLRKFAPHNKKYSNELARNRLGWYVPEGRILPMGDNRDNSHDGRFFGSVRMSKILGKGMIIYWPLSRIRGIN